MINKKLTALQLLQESWLAARLAEQASKRSTELLFDCMKALNRIVPKVRGARITFSVVAGPQVLIRFQNKNIGCFFTPQQQEQITDIQKMLEAQGFVVECKAYGFDVVQLHVTVKEEK